MAPGGTIFVLQARQRALLTLVRRRRFGGLVDRLVGQFGQIGVSFPLPLKHLVKKLGRVFHAMFSGAAAIAEFTRLRRLRLCRKRSRH